MKFGIFLEFLCLALLGVKGLIATVCVVLFTEAELGILGIYSRRNFISFQFRSIVIRVSEKRRTSVKTLESWMD